MWNVIRCAIISHFLVDILSQHAVAALSIHSFQFLCDVWKKIN